MTWELWLTTDRGKRLQTLPTAARFSCVRVVNNIGGFSVALPGSFDHTIVSRDFMVEFWRRGELFMIGLIRSLRFRQAVDGTDLIYLEGSDQVELLSRRIVAYDAGTTQADKTTNLDDMMKEIVDENFAASATDTDRDWSGQNFTISGDLADAPSDSKAFSRRNVLKVLQDLAFLSAEGGTDLFFDLVPQFASNDTVGFNFATYTGQPGRDRTGTNQTLFGTKYGNMVEPVLEYDWTREITYVYAGGQGRDDSRYTGTASDTTRINESIWNRREGYVDARNERSKNAVDARANEELNRGKPITKFSGRLLDTKGTRYGRDWEYGDKVVAEYQGIQKEVVVYTVEFNIKPGEEQIKARFKDVS